MRRSMHACAFKELEVILISFVSLFVISYFVWRYGIFVLEADFRRTNIWCGYEIPIR